MLTERLIFTLLSVPVILLALFFVVVSPWQAVPVLRSSTIPAVRAAAKWQLAAWAVLVALIAAYFLSGWWYRENMLIRPVDPLEVFCLLMLLVFGVHLPSVAYGRLRKARKKARAAENG